MPSDDLRRLLGRSISPSVGARAFDSPTTKRRLVALDSRSTNDILAGYSTERVHRWYRRLAKATAAEKVESTQPLAATFLNHYLDVNMQMSETDRELEFEAPGYLRNLSGVIEGLKYHRRVHLTQENARIGKNQTKRAGILPRWESSSKKRVQVFSWYYQSLVDVAPGNIEILRIQCCGTAAEVDLLTSLRGFQLRTDVTARAESTNKDTQLRVEFQVFNASVLDRYDFNFDEYQTLPNPDSGSQDKDAIRPDLESFRVYHRNAKRMEDKGLAAAYNLKSQPWEVTDSSISGPARISL